MEALSLIIFLVLFAFTKDVWCRHHAHFNQSRNEDKIVGGYADTVQNVPYIVYLRLQNANNKYFQCAGSIISKNYILTAAHCTQGMVKATIRAGSSSANSGGQLYTSAQIIQHPSYSSQSKNYDVAVIRTTKAIKLDGTTKVIKLPKQESVVKPGTKIKVSGWGATKENGNSSPNLRSVVVQAVANDVCSRQLGMSIMSCKICAGVPGGGKDACQGDSGGPAVVPASGRNVEQVGIVSYGIGCARPGKPGVYTRVSCATVRSWIKRTTGV